MSENSWCVLFSCVMTLLIVIGTASCEERKKKEGDRINDLEQRIIRLEFSALPSEVRP